MFLSRGNSWSTWHLSTVVTLANISLSRQCVDGSCFRDSLRCQRGDITEKVARLLLTGAIGKAVYLHIRLEAMVEFPFELVGSNGFDVILLKRILTQDFSANDLLCDDVNPGSVIMCTTKECTFKRMKCTDWFWFMLTREERHGDETARHLPLPMEHTCWSDLVNVARAAYCSEVSAAPSSACTCSGKLETRWQDAYDPLNVKQGLIFQLCPHPRYVTLGIPFFSSKL